MYQSDLDLLTKARLQDTTTRTSTPSPTRLGRWVRRVSAHLQARRTAG
ncbi:hypothetical protein [Deinococcus irradiatisoli]|nr:hypothetical protein [Deinococcus irradiatisoli]